ncbi:MAG: tRNA (adenosine(37)-N6)-threonylcarbamoyltransferase complex dimerization subunit type 1 TsaB [Elusimicrobia bacterium]|nr:tRNA (adenosine(37)-N6)-threonylcarbamoyltransferase complex dimerization subunit type 1 TsaB [Elusimicrobiota bacterium]
MAREITAGICTSGSRIKTALYASGKFSTLSRRELNQEKFLIPMLEKLLKKHNAALKDLSAVCVITGPGRFTGLRISLTFAAALKTLTGMKVYSSTLFEILAMQALASRKFGAWAAGRKSPRLAAIVHAFKDEYFCQAFQVTGKQVTSCQSAKSPDCRLPGHQTGDLGRWSLATSYRSLVTGYKCAAVEAPRWLKDTEIAGYLNALGSELYVAADSEEKPEIYALVPAGFEKAPPAVSRIEPAFIIKTGLALKNKSLKPLYLKPAKYELENRKVTSKQ